MIKFIVSLAILFGGGAIAGKAGYQFLWSLNSLAKILKYSLGFNYIVSILLTLIIFILTSTLMEEE